MQHMRAILPMLAAAALSGCSTARDFLAGPNLPPAGRQGHVPGFLGGVAAEEPNAAAAARAVLSAGGNAADAAAAAGFVLSVTLPSRAGLGGGGACLVYHPRRDAPEAIIFMPGVRQGSVTDGDRPAAVPLMARGLFALTTRMPGGRPFEEIIAPAEQMARFGTTMSRTLLADIEAVREPLFRDPQIRAVFAPQGTVVPVGERFTNTDLAGTFTTLRTLGVADMYQGALSRRIETAMAEAGGGRISHDELRNAVPALGPATVIDGRGGERIALLPLDGGLAVGAAYRALAAGQGMQAAQARALAVAAAARAGVPGDAASLLDRADLPAGNLGTLPASTALTVFDRTGGAVTCAFTMNNLFGTGRMMPGTGIIAAAAPGVGRVQPPLMSAAIAWAPNIRSLRAAISGSGQADAPMAVAAPLNALVNQRLSPRDAVPVNTTAQGRTQFGGCSNYLPGSQSTCAAVSDARGTGVALGAVD
ncbi:gamma-glutamyltranspeptidase [Rhodovarius crocodyli]|uniref:Gamma-glutamyltranspeptidase n=1 Tax=Rhodovarius crocodyli TaxID=1979269 RepID=A0A437MHA8_9PROT|nr:gamma-glutamyltransferase [Rhodovarius crocodyli]RVT97033.1 gamma-glutamyltranspeptidase [Rhodovarius crocodyli]